MSYATIVLPPDLVIAALKADNTIGWFGGAAVKAERVFVITSAQIDGEKKYSGELRRLLSHRAFHLSLGEPKHELVRWVRVRRGFVDQFCGWEHIDQTKFEKEIGCRLAGGSEYFCFIEPTDGSPKIRAVCAWTPGAYTCFAPIDITLLLRPEPYARLAKNTADALAPKQVGIVGVGSGGGAIALQLATAGVGHLLLVDADKIEQENYIRHELARRDLGRTKVNGLKSDLEDRELPTQVAAHFLDVLACADDFRKLLDDHKPDLLICATDSRRSRSFVNYCAMRRQIPLIIAGILDNGRIGEVLLANPGRTACYECVRREFRSALDQTSSTERPETPYLDADADDSGSTTHRFDVDFVASLATRVALQVLAPQEFGPVPTSYLVWGRETTQYRWPFNFDLPLSLKYVPIVRHADCPVCGTVASDLDSLDIDDYFAAILAEADEIPG